MNQKYYKIIFSLYIILYSSELNSGHYINKNSNYVIRNLEETIRNDSYMIIYFKKDCEYKEFYNIYRRNISYIINQENNVKLTSKTAFNINKEFGIEIHFETEVKSLEYFFSKGLDKNMEYLISVDFTKFDSSLVTRMNNMFYGCNSLRSINLSNSDISKIESMELMFYGCSSLLSINLSNLTATKLDEMSEMFRECKSLKSVNFSNFDCPLIFSMSFIFFGCSSLEYIDFTNFHTPQLFDMYNMFYGCTSLKSINLSSFDTSQVSIMNNMFYGCSSLRTIDLSNFDMKTCTSYDDIFSSIDNIKYINLYNFKNDKIISQIFNEAKNIFFVCQKDNIIINPNAYNCCDFNFETEECNSYQISTYLNKEDSPSNSTNSTIDMNTQGNNTNSPEIIKKSSSSKISIGFIILIISGIILILIIIIFIIIICCRKKKDYNNKFNDTMACMNQIKSSKNLNTSEYESKNNDENIIIINFISTSSHKLTILFDPNKKLCELIKEYFKKLGQEELYNEPSIRFLLNANLISHNSQDSLNKYIKNDMNTITIFVDDLYEKIKPKQIN